MRPSPRGVTVVELLTTLVVAGLLASIAVPGFELLKTRAARRDLVRSVSLLEREIMAVHRRPGGLPPAWSCTPDVPANAPPGPKMEIQWFSEPWRTLALYGSAPIDTSGLRFCLLTSRLPEGPAFAALWTFHDFDDDGLTGGTLTYLVESREGELVRARPDSDPAPFE